MMIEPDALIELEENARKKNGVQSEDLKILTICQGVDGNIYGLGEDSKVYQWNANTANWNLHKRES